jgi:preprotein translocase subunit SecD
MKKNIWLVGIMMILSVMLVSCQYITGDFRDKTNARKPGIFMEIKLEPIDVRQSSLSSRDMNQIKDVMERRIASLGVISSQVTFKGQTMQIEIDGYNNLGEARNVIEKTGELLFTDEIGGIIISGKNLKNSEFVFQTDPSSGAREPVIQLTFDEDGAKLFTNGTKANIGKNILITLDDQVLMSPKVNEVINDGKVVITFGGGSSEETIQTVKEMASILKGGSIPAKVVILKSELCEDLMSK